MTDVKVRFAPSPTGNLHVGNLRTALVNHLFARRAGGHFMLRIDDTDTERSTAEFETSIRADLQWMGMSWDSEDRQSARLDRYDAALRQLADAGRAYPCYETPEELALKRKAQLSAGRPPVYDRAALVALPEGMRELYAAHLAAITGRAPQLLVTFDYDQSVMDGPPFAVDEAGLRRCHDARFEIERLAEAEVPGGLKGVCPAIESAFLLRPSAETACS